MIHNDYAQVGGEYFSVRAETESLKRRGLEVELLTLDNSDLLSAGGRRRVAFESVVPRTSPALVSEAIHRFRPDLVHAQNLFPLMGGGVIDQIAQSGLPWVRTLRNYRLRCIAGTMFREGSPCQRCTSARAGIPGVLSACYRGSVTASIAATVYANRETHSKYRHPPAAYILLSEAMRPAMAHLLEDSPVFIKPNSVEGDLTFSPTPRLERSDEFIYAGRFTPEKGVSDLIASFAAKAHLRLTLVGDGELSDADRRTIGAASNITLAGRLANTEVQSRMQRALAVVVPSKWAEPFGRVAAESLANGTPALVSRTGGLTEIVDGVKGAALTVGPEDDWASRAEGILELEPAQYDRLAQSSHDRWAECYSEKPVGDRLVAIYDRVLSLLSGASR